MEPWKLHFNQSERLGLNVLRRPLNTSPIPWGGLYLCVMGMLVLCQDLYGAAGVATKARDGALGQTERRRIMSETPPPPLPVPWLAHEQFAVTKKVCSSRDGLSNVKKSAVVRVVQELKVRGKTRRLDSLVVMLTSSPVITT